MKLYFGHPGDQPDYHAYEALQIFGLRGNMPEFVPGEPSMWLRAVYEDGAAVTLSVPDLRDSKELERFIYLKMSDITGYSSPWGCLTGVRPTKIVNQLLSAGKSPEGVMDELTGFYCASDTKALLALDTALNQKPFIDRQAADPSRIGIYIGIPFCPSRCLYCSFTSNSIEKYKKSVGPYLELLRTEMAETALIVREQGLKIESVYIGGGTPTSLDDETFARFIDDVVNNFVAPSQELCEFSVEAGRPDSITPGKLGSMRAAGVSRISVNPQTMNDETLRLIGRRHTADDMLKAFAMARETGFDNINTDIICGLPGEDEAAFSHTLDVICDLSPESVTVHTLSVKRAADLKRDILRSTLQADITGSMVSSAYSRLCGLGFHPYYMYRQKNMVGNHENVAYCRPGFESPYNIHIMEEDQTILACGAGAVSKQVAPGVIRRAFNVKSVEDYLARSGEMSARKRELFDSCK